MREIKYYLKKHMISTVIAMLLFIVQGLCVVALVVFGSNVINTGLLNYGYESNSPEALLQPSFESRLATLKDKDRELVQSHYTLLDKDNMTVDEYQVYERSYPVIASKTIYKRNWIGLEEVNDQLEEVFSISTEEMLYEYMNLGMKPMDNQANYIRHELELMTLAAVIFALTFWGANVLVARISSKIAYEERVKMVGDRGIGLRQSLDLQDKSKAAANWFYAGVLSICGISGGIYYYNDYGLSPIVDQAQIVIWSLALVVFAVAIYSAISIRGILNKGVFLVGKVIVLGIVTAIFGSKISLSIIVGYIIMLGMVMIIRKSVRCKLNSIISDHEDNIENIDGQMSFVMNKEDVAIEVVQMKKMVRSYLTNNEYLYRSSWMLEFLESIDKAVVALFNFFGVIVVVAGFSYLYISMGIPLIMILPLLLIYTF